MNPTDNPNSTYNNIVLIEFVLSVGFFKIDVNFHRREFHIGEGFLDVYNN